MNDLRRPAAIDLAVDSSAVIALLRDEPGADAIRQALGDSRAPVISAASVVESNIVSARYFHDAGPDGVDQLLRNAEVIVMPVDRAIADGAHAAWERFGRGNHPARLNFGDCFSYALASHLDVPLLCVGDDFAQTDIRVVPEPPV